MPPLSSRRRSEPVTMNDAAKVHHDRLFGDRVSTLARTDPEFVAYFDNFAFDEILRDAADLDESVDMHTRLLVQLAAVLAAGGLAEFKVLAAAGSANARVTPVELKELVYQAVAYVGMARAYDYLHAVNEILTAAGVDLPLPGQATSAPETRADRGHERQEQIVGAGRVDQMHVDASEPTAKHFQRYLTGNCFGDTVGREGLDLPTRELLTFAMLTALGGADAQVRGHITGNLNVGNTRARLLAVLTVLVPFIGYPRTLNALAAINESQPHRPATDHEPKRKKKPSHARNLHLRRRRHPRHRRTRSPRSSTPPTPWCRSPGPASAVATYTPITPPRIPPAGKSIGHEFIGVVTEIGSRTSRL